MGKHFLKSKVNKYLYDSYAKKLLGIENPPIDLIDLKKDLLKIKRLIQMDKKGDYYINEDDNMTYKEKMEFLESLNIF